MRSARLPATMSDPLAPAPAPVPSGLSTRRPRREDAGAVTAVIRAAEVAICGESLANPGDLLFDWADSRVSLDRDAWVVVDQRGRVVGYACSFGHDPADAIDLECVVHPDVEGTVLDEQLLGMLLRRAGEQADEAGLDRRAVTVSAHCVRQDVRRRALYERLGFERVRVFLRMVIGAGDLPEPPPWPDGIIVAAFRPGVDDHALHAVVQDAFLDHYRGTPVPFDVWSAQVFGDDDFDAGLALIARAGDDAVGAVVALTLPEAGYIEYLAVRRSWRGRGLGAALLVHGLHLLAARGVELIFLGVDAESATGADRLYRRVGMRVQREDDVYERRLEDEAVLSR
jgi:mycothiol synthase